MEIHFLGESGGATDYLLVLFFLLCFLCCQLAVRGRKKGMGGLQFTCTEFGPVNSFRLYLVTHFYQ